jgi:hypothetical protein
MWGAGGHLGTMNYIPKISGKNFPSATKKLFPLPQLALKGCGRCSNATSWNVRPGISSQPRC